MWAGRHRPHRGAMFGSGMRFGVAVLRSRGLGSAAIRSSGAGLESQPGTPGCVLLRRRRSAPGRPTVMRWSGFAALAPKAHCRGLGRPSCGNPGCWLLHRTRRSLPWPILRTVEVRWCDALVRFTDLRPEIMRGGWVAVSCTEGEAPWVFRGDSSGWSKELFNISFNLSEYFRQGLPIEHVFDIVSA